MNVMCVLKNITFSQDDQKNGGLQLREDTPFVYAIVTKKETQHLLEKLEKINEGAAATIRKPKPFMSFVQFVVEATKKVLRQSVNERLIIQIDNCQFEGGMLQFLVPSSDIVLFISCEGWPSCAREWITRE
ncbi:Hypothetical predicted protein [Paramuricea clavata]|uniref:Uncharacterized protein n=1 Tax=Paramuricea clavata TaxID=317549 RepID=A0A6S7FQ38_PARCT|nr:Hypothetical predicted protein [Paramuricea clavata]